MTQGLVEPAYSSRSLGDVVPAVATALGVDPPADEGLVLPDAPAYVAGYALHNDYSERQDQLERMGQWSKGKSQDGYAPFGPFLATPDELGDIHALPMWLTVNGESRQKSSTKEMVYKVPFLVSYLSRFMTLLPGDVISTGTPAGVGLGMNPPTFLKAGDVVELGIDGLGTQRQKIVASV